MSRFSRRQISIIIVTLAVAFGLYLMYILPLVFNPLLLGLAIAYILNPAVRFLERKRVPRKLAVGLLSLGTCLVLLLAATALSVRGYYEILDWQYDLVGESYTDLNQNGSYDGPVPDLPEGDAGATIAPPATAIPEPFDDRNQNGMRDAGILERLRVWAHAQNEDDSPVRRYLGRYITPEQIQHLQTQLIAGLKDSAGTILHNASSWAANLWEGGLLGVGWLWNAAMYLILTPIYTIFLLYSLENGWDLFSRYIPGAFRERTLGILRKIDLVISAFFRGRLLVCLAMGLVTAVGFLIVGVRFGMLLGLLIGLLSMIPFVSGVGLIPALLLCWLDGFGLGQFIGVFIAFGVGQSLDPLLTSLILGKDLSLHPITILVSLFACGALFGFFGMMLAVPIVASAKILAREFLLPHLEILANETPPAHRPTKE